MAKKSKPEMRQIITELIAAARAVNSLDEQIEAIRGQRVENSRELESLKNKLRHELRGMPDGSTRILQIPDSEFWIVAS